MITGNEVRQHWERVKDEFRGMSRYGRTMALASQAMRQVQAAKTRQAPTARPPVVRKAAHAA